MKTVCELNKCVGCMACIEVCQKNAIKIQDRLKNYNAIIDSKQCIECNVCHNICPRNNPETKKNAIKWYQGWAIDNIRKHSSSGGFAASILSAFISKGNYVCSCCFINGQFKYLLTNEKKYLNEFIGSKYVKSNPEGIYTQIKNILRTGNKVLFIGLPCHVAALKRFLYRSDEKNLYTIDLICHGTPSPQILETYLKEEGYDIYNIRNISFRNKDNFNLYIDNKSIAKRESKDRYTIGFLKGLFYTDNCYECEYATVDRVSDLTIGDSWGSRLPEEERKRGISLALCQSEKGIELLEIAKLYLKEVDLENAVEANEQLKRPSNIPKERKKFFDEYEKSKSVKKAVLMCYPKRCIKQMIKSILSF